MFLQIYQSQPIRSAAICAVILYYEPLEKCEFQTQNNEENLSFHVYIQEREVALLL